MSSAKAAKISLTIDALRAHHAAQQTAIRARLAEFDAVRQRGDDAEIFRELVFCIFTANASARMGLRAVEAVKDLLPHAPTSELAAKLTGVHRFPNARAAYISVTREFLEADCNSCLRDRLEGFTDDLERRDWFAQTKQIKGLGFKEASHFLRNVGFRGLAILDKHILNSLVELNVIDDAAPPSNRAKYLAVETKLRAFADRIAIDFDELDLVLWSHKTGEILK